MPVSSEVGLHLLFIGTIGGAGMPSSAELHLLKLELPSLG
jgi:hypothetical protein